MDKRIEELVKEAKSRLAEYGAEVMALIQNGELAKLPELTDKSVLHILSIPDLALIVECERCAGRGVFHSEGYGYGEDKPITCSQCHGTGIVPISLASILKEAKDG